MDEEQKVQLPLDVHATVKELSTICGEVFELMSRSVPSNHMPRVIELAKRAKEIGAQYERARKAGQ